MCIIVHIQVIGILNRDDHCGQTRQDKRRQKKSSKK